MKQYIPGKKDVIAVDLDGTLAASLPEYTYEKHYAVIGPPVPRMVKRVKKWLDKGEKVVILTARMHSSEHPDRQREIRNNIRRWCKKYLGKALPVTSEKHHSFTVIYDDRARQVIRDTGKIVKEK